MKILKNKDTYTISCSSSDISLTEQEIVELANTMELFKQNNINMFIKDYESLSIDDVNSLRLGYNHNEAEDFRKGLVFLNIRAYKLYRVGEVYLIYDFVYDCDELRLYDGSREYPEMGLSGYEDIEGYVSSNYIEKCNYNMIMSEKVTNMYLRSHLSSEIIDELLDMPNIDIRINGEQVDAYSFFSEKFIVEYNVALCSDS